MFYGEDMPENEFGSIREFSPDIIKILQIDLNLKETKC